VVDPLCQPSPPESPAPAKPGRLPPVLARVARQVEEVRGLSFKRAVAAEPLSRREIEKLVADSYEEEVPRDQAEAEERALITIGALPEGTDLYKAVLDFGTSQIIGFYDTETRRLVFESDETPSPLARFTFAHELTHALDDQHFDLGLLDDLNRTCLDDRAAAYLSLVEGDAVLVQFEWARTTLSQDEIQQIQQEAAAFPPPPATVPRFVQEQFAFPYEAGQAFVEALLARGGLDALDEALRNPPISTEQVLHPARYPSDAPQDVLVPDLSASLGMGWKAIDFSEVGEGFLRDMLELDLPPGEARVAASGWDGGEYRAFANGSRTAVLLQTVWDSGRDAGEFAGAMRRWIGSRHAEVTRSGASVTVLFASDAQTLGLLREASSS
jgi:hypothetical protein